MRKTALVIVALALATAACTAASPTANESTSTAAETTTSSTTPASTTTLPPSAMKQLDDAPQQFTMINSAAQNDKRTMLYKHIETGWRLSLSDEYTGGRELELVDIELREQVNPNTEAVFWCGSTNPKQVQPSLAAFGESVKQLKAGVEFVSTSTEGVSEMKDTKPGCWIMYYGI